MRTLLRAGFVSSLVLLPVLTAPRTASADGTAQTLPFTQNWTTTTLITADDIWTLVPGIVGYNGTGMGASGTADPQTLLGTGTETLQVWANHANPDTFASGGVAEFDGITNPTIALQGSNTNGAPNIVITLNTTGRVNIMVSYLLRDIDGSTDNAVQHVALQYRVGTTGMYTNLPAGYVADATTAGTATQTTPVSVTLPVACENQALVELRIITANATGNDEWVGIDDISITAVPAACGNGMMDAGEGCDAGAANGTTVCGCTARCQFATTTTTCGAPLSGACDAPDTCDGAGACAAHVAPNGMVCHPSTGLCDPAETCNGVATTCPTDAFLAAGTMCRAAAGVCDVVDRCNGTTGACPDAAAANGVGCDDGLLCNGADACMAGACVHAGAPSCDDANACTADACVEATPMCMHTLTAAPACCNANSDCADSDVCTTDACTGPGGVCTFDPVSNCCNLASECDDLDPCTTDSCDTSVHHCTHTGSCVDSGTDAGSVTMVDSGTMTDAGGASDSGTSDGSTSDATSGGPDAGRSTPRAGGCGCSAVGTRHGEGVLGFLALALVLAARRRRVSSR